MMPTSNRSLCAAGFSSRNETKQLLRLAWPGIMEQILVTLVQFVDSAMVGRLGATATASIGVVTTSVWLLNGLLTSVSIAFSVILAQRIGAGDEAGVERLVRQALFFGLFYGFLVGGLGLAISAPLPAWLRADPSLHSGASSYFRLIALNMPIILQVNIISGLFRGAGNTKTPMILNSMLSVLNTVFNFFLIYPSRPASILPFTIPGAGLGVTGAALGTMLATAVTALAAHFVLLRGNKGLWLRRGYPLRLDAALRRRLFQLAWPLGLEQIARSSAQVALTVIVAQLGEVAVAANYLGINAESLSYLPAFGLSAAATALVGQAVGARNRGLAESYAYVAQRIGAVMMVISGLVLYFFAAPLMRIFTTDAEVIALGSRVLRIEAFAQPLFGASILIGGVLRGAGDTRTPFLINLFSMWAVRLTAAYFLAPIYGLTGVWIAMCAELNIRGLVFVYRLYRRKWLDHAIPPSEADSRGRAEPLTDKTSA